MNAHQLLIVAFVEECLEEINERKHPEVSDVFNFGLASADGAIRRMKTKYLNKLENENEDDDKIF